MKASSITIIESLKEKLMCYPTLVDSLQKKDSTFLPSLEHWMKEVETIFKTYNISECSEIAGLRSKILAPLYSDNQRSAIKKKQYFVAAEVLYDIQRTVSEVIKPHELRVEEARDLILQLLGIIQQTDSVKYNSKNNFQDFINQLWTIISTHEQLKPTTIKIHSLLIQPDVIRIIANEIKLEEWGEKNQTTNFHRKI
ncbi:hypothetical protein [Flavobacterium sp.]|uniref:hypothetical protein n=1 Tax=Flavobacterium sp. TaxID=239 RepID=UPI002619C6E3|nr:hypothetical protein [Flavobacterium sp.]MDG2433066.1 hypothetical protein [Flavobacterium sp.]